MENIIDTICAKAMKLPFARPGQILKRGGFGGIPHGDVYGLGRMR